MIAGDFVTGFSLWPIARHTPDRLQARIWDLRDNFTAYDASYVALAEALGVPLWTHDARLARAAEPYCDVISD